MRRKAQIWVETAIYALIGLTIIGIVLAIATPAIDRYKDKIVIEQTIAALEGLNSKILEVGGTKGSVRIVEFRVKNGELVIDSATDKISYVLKESRLEYSEPGTEIKQGEVYIKTETNGKKYDISLVLKYGENIDLTYNGNADEKKTFNQASLPYKFSIENKGETGEIVNIDIKDIS